MDKQMQTQSEQPVVNQQASLQQPVITIYNNPTMTQTSQPSINTSSANESANELGSSNTTTNTINAENTSANTNSNRNTNSTRTNIHVATEQILHMLKQTYAHARAIDPRKQARSMAKKLSNYTVEIIAGSVTGVYLTICWMLVSTNHYLKRPDLWSKWKKQATLEQLFEISQQELAKDLIRDIQCKYMNLDNPTDIIMPLVRFVQAVDNEMNSIKRYISLATNLDQLHVLVIFPATKKTIKRAKKQLKRLQFVKHVFASWAVEYSMNNVGGLKSFLANTCAKYRAGQSQRQSISHHCHQSASQRQKRHSHFVCSQNHPHQKRHKYCGG